MHQAKIFARLFDYSATPDMPDGTLRVTVEWKRLSGARVGGKASFIIEDITSDDKMKSDLRDALAEHLSDKFAPEVFRPRDIVGIPSRG